MTTEIRQSVVTDISEPNSALCLRTTGELNLSASVWSTDANGSLRDARLRCLEAATEKVLTRYPTHTLWLLVGHGAWQPDNRITRSRRLWKSLKARGLSLPAGEFFEEFTRESNSGIRFFGAAVFGITELRSAHEVILAERGSCIISFPQDQRDVVREITERGWELLSSNPPEEVLRLICSDRGIVFGIYGSFDDGEAAVAAIGEYNIVASL